MSDWCEHDYRPGKCEWCRDLQTIDELREQIAEAQREIEALKMLLPPVGSITFPPRCEGFDLAREAKRGEERDAWERLANEWQKRFANMRGWVLVLRNSALFGSDYAKVARVLTVKALRGEPAPIDEERAAEEVDQILSRFWGST